MLVLSLVAVGATGTVAAQDYEGDWDSETCKEHMGSGWTLTCTLAPGLAEPPQKVDHSDGFDARSTILTQNASLASDAAAFKRTAKRLEGALWSIGFAEYRDELANGSANSVAMSEAQQAIQKHGTAELQTLVDKNNLHVENVADVSRLSENSDSFSLYGVAGNNNPYNSPLHNADVQNQSVSWAGEEFNVSVLQSSDSETGSGYAPILPNNPIRLRSRKPG